MKYKTYMEIPVTVEYDYQPEEPDVNVGEGITITAVVGNLLDSEIWQLFEAEYQDHVKSEILETIYVDGES